jgi:hypothetical protein
MILVDANVLLRLIQVSVNRASLLDRAERVENGA